MNHLILLVIAVVIFLTGVSMGSGSSSMEDYIVEVEAENTELRNCVESLQATMSDVRSSLGNYEESYEDMYYLIHESENYLDPYPSECD